jgi:hypothetical protein
VCGRTHARFDRGPLARTADTHSMGDEAKALRPNAYAAIQSSGPTSHSREWTHGFLRSRSVRWWTSERAPNGSISSRPRGAELPLQAELLGDRPSGRRYCGRAGHDSYGPGLLSERPLARVGIRHGGMSRGDQRSDWGTVCDRYREGYSGGEGGVGPGAHAVTCAPPPVPSAIRETLS